MYKFSVVIPTYNSSEYLQECIYGFKNSKYLQEIIIGDDCSKIGELENIKSIIKKANNFFDFKIKLLESTENNGAFKNKYRLIDTASSEWVYQIDSDNVPFPNIDNVISDIIVSHNSQMYIYYPSKLIQFWKHKRIAGILSRVQKKYKVRFSKEMKVFDLEQTKQAINEFLRYDTKNDITVGSPELDSKFLLDKHIYWVLNCGNFIVNKKQFLEAMNPGLNLPRKILSMDAVAFSYFWLSKKGSIVLHPGLRHYHRKRLSSISNVEKKSSKISRKYFTDKILSLPKSDFTN